MFPIFLAVSFVFDNFGILALRTDNTRSDSLGEALALVLLPSQCVSLLLNLNTELIQVGSY